MVKQKTKKKPGRKQVKRAVKQKTKKKPGRKQVKRAVKQIAAPETKAVALRESKPIAPAREVMTEAKIIEAFDAMGITSKLDAQKKKLFIAVAREFNLNPLRREIHAVKMGGGDDDDSGSTLVPVVGYEVYIDRAEETGRLEYWFLEEAGEIDIENWRRSTYRVTLVIKRRDWPKEFRWSVRFVEAAGLKWDSAKKTQVLNAMWRKRGHFMTQKCAIGQGFRLVFREILKGMPYIDAEIENAENGQPHEAEEEKGELRAPQAVTTSPAKPAPGPPPQLSGGTGPYGEIMTALNERVRSKEGPVIALFDSVEKMEWKVKADQSRDNPEELQGVREELEKTASIRRQRVQEGI